VVTMYVPGKSRDRSHYEHFRTYHESFYRFVEPTSVTPYSMPAIDRALHALIVIAARQEQRVAGPRDVTPTSAWLDELKSWLVARAESAGTERRYIEAIKKRFQHILDIWDARQDRVEWGAPSAKSDEGDHLLYPPSAVEEYKKGLGAPTFEVPFPTPTSMRNVDVESRLRIGSKYGAGILTEKDDGEEKSQ